MSSYNNLPATGFSAKSPDIPDIPDNLTLALAVCQDVSVVRAAPEIGVRVGAFYTLLSSRLRRGARAGREKQEAELLTRTPPRKIRAQFQEHKHTSLTSLVGESWRIWPSGLENDLRNGDRNP